jgi:cyanate lyase
VYDGFSRKDVIMQRESLEDDIMSSINITLDIEEKKTDTIKRSHARKNINLTPKKWEQKYKYILKIKKLRVSTIHELTYSR